MDGKEIIPYIDPIFRFCHHRLNNWHDAEDLAGEILLHILDGIGKYEISSLESWVWRIAHNRYARFIDARNRRQSILSGQELSEVEADCLQPEEASMEEEYEPVFICLHTLSSEYRDIFVDYYIGEMSVKQLSRKYTLPETTIKWRLNVGRSRIRERIGTDQMDKVYQRINWNTNGCNGSMDASRYLHSQIARAICKAAYEKPLTVEEISLCTGIPTIYIEDELPRLIYGDAIEKIGNKYATDFIIFRLKDRAATEAVLEPMVKEIADHYEKLLWGVSAGGEGQPSDRTQKVEESKPCGSGFGMERLGYMLIPYFIRAKLEELKNGRLHLSNGNFPPRKDGGHGWFIVPETADAGEEMGEYSTGCNINNTGGGYIYYYHVRKYYDWNVYGNRGTAWLAENGIPQKCPGGIVPEGLIDREDMAQLVRNNLIRRDGDGYVLNFPCFTRGQFEELRARYQGEDAELDSGLCRWILSVRKSFEGFVPTRLHGQINQWLSVYCGELVGHVIEELICRGRLEKPGSGNAEQRAEPAGQKEKENAGGAKAAGEGCQEPEKPLVNGVFYVDGDFMLI